MYPLSCSIVQRHANKLSLEGESRNYIIDSQPSKYKAAIIEIEAIMCIWLEV